MLRKYKKTDAPAWQRKLLAILGVLFGGTLLLFLVWAVMLFLLPAALRLVLLQV